MTAITPIRRAIVIAACLTVACSGNTPTSPSAPSTTTPKAVPTVAPGIWVALGASTTAGWLASTPSRGWVARLQSAVENRGVAIFNLAVPGAVTSQWRPLSSTSPGRLTPLPSNNIDAAMRERPSLLFLNATNNDIVANITIEETLSNLMLIRDIAVAGGAAVMMLSTQPRNITATQLALLRTLDSRLSSAFGGCFVDIRTPLADRDGRLAANYDGGDGVHPNDAGHSVIFQQVNDALQSGRCVSPVR